MSQETQREVATHAARWVVEEGMEYGEAKRRAARALGQTRPQALPSDEMLEEEVRAHIELFCADTQPAELRALREAALVWCERLAPFRPHLGGAVWRGTATRQSAVRIDLYCDDSKSAEIELLNQGVNFEVASLQRAGQPAMDVMTVLQRSAALGEDVTIHLLVHDADGLRGALKPDAQGRTWRGSTAQLRGLLRAQDAAALDRPAG